MGQVRNAIITGARGGIGRAAVQVFAEHGVNIWACMREEDGEFLDFARQLCEQNAVWIKPVYFDLKFDDQIKQGMREIFQEKKAVDILVNNAGIPHGAFLQMTSMQELRDVFQVNFFAQVLVMQLVSRLMIRQKRGNIINLSSVAGLDGDPGYTAYGSSKAAVAFATRSVSKELARYGIRVNAVAPGLTRTRMMEQMEENARAGMIDAASMQRPGRPEEIAQAIYYLASDEASYITGQVLRVDGGL